MSSFNSYEEALQYVLDNGVDSNDRTGTGTLSVFDVSIKYNLKEGFPLLTSKKMFWKGAFKELKWFLSGSTNVNDLDASVQQWWTPWASSNGDLGAIYGNSYRTSRWWMEVEPKYQQSIRKPLKLNPHLYLGVGDLGQYEKESENDPSYIKELKNNWKSILRRCYDKDSYGYRSQGLFEGVDERWFSFENFVEDVKKLPNWFLYLEHSDEYFLDKDILSVNGNYYTKDVCMWATAKELDINRKTKRFGDKVIRFRELDQVKYIIASIKHDPYSRRHVINLWHSPAMQHTNLNCCHGSVIQFYVRNGSLSCKMYQRSGDIFLGVPVNLASYALLVHMIAYQCRLDVGELIWTGGDVHIYKNHIEQVKKQLNNHKTCPVPLPSLHVAEGLTSVFDYELEDFEIKNYNPHPAIKAPLAV